MFNNISPSHYNPKNVNIVSHSVTFPKNTKPVDTLNDNPDPTYYNADPNLVKSAYPNYSMGSKYPSIMEDTGSNPGPGHYNNPEITLSSTLSKKSKFGTQPRFS